MAYGAAAEPFHYWRLRSAHSEDSRAVLPVRNDRNDVRAWRATNQA
jgi:hypothetical protein